MSKISSRFWKQTGFLILGKMYTTMVPGTHFRFPLPNNPTTFFCHPLSLLLTKVCKIKAQNQSRARKRSRQA
jgi:hypothetical protein